MGRVDCMVVTIFSVRLGLIIGLTFRYLSYFKTYYIILIERLSYKAISRLVKEYKVESLVIIFIILSSISFITLGDCLDQGISIIYSR